MAKGRNLDKNYWKTEFGEIWEECHNCGHLIEDSVMVADRGEREYLRCEYFLEVDNDYVEITHCPRKTLYLEE